MRTFSVFALSSLAEGTPVTLLEAMACGTPVVATGTGGSGEFLDDEVNCLLFTPGDAADLCAKMAWAEDHPERMLAMGEAARRHHQRELTGEAGYRRLMQIYREAIDAPAPP